MAKMRPLRDGYTYRSWRWILVGVFLFGVFGLEANVKKEIRMINRADALAIAKNTLAKTDPNRDFVIVDKETIEREFGWVFFYTTKKYLETGDRRYIVPGNSPIVVKRIDGTAEQLSTAASPDLVIAAYEEEWKRGQRDSEHSEHYISKGKAIAIAEKDAKKKCKDLAPFKVEAKLSTGIWHIAYELADSKSEGGGPSYDIDATTGKIIDKRYEQ